VGNGELLKGMPAPSAASGGRDEPIVGSLCNFAGRFNFSGIRRANGAFAPAVNHTGSRRLTAVNPLLT
jgi:hypothetical protein